MDVKLSTEGYEILSSGSIIVPSNEDVQFEIKKLRFRFTFIQNAHKDDDVQIERMVDSDEKGEFLAIIIKNMNNSFFASTKQSVKVATLERRPLYVRFSILSINREEENKAEDKILFYTWYLSNKTVEEGASNVK